MPDVQFKRKLNKREQNRLRVLKKKNEGNIKMVLFLYFGSSNNAVMWFKEAAEDDDSAPLSASEQDVAVEERNFHSCYVL